MTSILRDNDDTFRGTGSRADHNRDDLYFRRTQSDRMAAAVWANDNGRWPLSSWLTWACLGAVVVGAGLAVML